MDVKDWRVNWDETCVNRSNAYPRCTRYIDWFDPSFQLPKGSFSHFSRGRVVGRMGLDDELAPVRSVRTETHRVSDDSEDDDHPKTLRPAMRKSCDFCFKRKRKCDGDGITKCSFCVLKNQEECTFRTRKRYDSRNRRAQRDIVAKANSSSTVEVGAAQLQDTEVEKTPRVTLKRCRMKPSLATGLVGMEENVFLRDYFRCLGFLPLMSESAVRHVIVSLMVPAAERRGRKRRDGRKMMAFGESEDGRRCWETADEEESSTVAFHALACTFWCVIAVGGLIQGRPQASVDRYVKRAEEALEYCSNVPTEDVARGHAALSLMYGFDMRHEDAVAAELKHADSIVSHLERRGGSVLVSEELGFFVRHMGRFRTTSKPLGKDCPIADWSIIPDPQQNAHVEGLQDRSMSTIDEVFLLLWRFNFKVLSTVFKAIFDRESRHGMVEGGISTPSQFSDDYALEIAWLKAAADRPLMMLSVVTNDLEGALEGARSIVETFERYPGLCRVSGRIHAVDIVTLILAHSEDHDTYGRLEAIYNPLRPQGAPLLAPLEKRLGMRRFCDHTICRFIEESMDMNQFGFLSRSPIVCPGEGTGTACDDSAACSAQGTASDQLMASMENELDLAEELIRLSQEAQGVAALGDSREMEHLSQHIFSEDWTDLAEALSCLPQAEGKGL